MAGEIEEDHALLALLFRLQGFVDSSAAKGKDTTWKDPEDFKPAVTTKAEAAKKKKRLLWVVPRGGGKSKASAEAAPPADKPAEKPAPKEPDK